MDTFNAESEKSEAEQWAAKVNRAANDPSRIEKRKLLAPALTVPRYRG